MASRSSFRGLVASHFVIFSVGVAVGISVNANELNAYRSNNETFSSKLRRYTVNASLGIAVATVLVMGAQTLRGK